MELQERVGLGTSILENLLVVSIEEEKECHLNGLGIYLEGGKQLL